MPVRAKRVVYFEDPFFKGIHGAQKGELPFPPPPKPPSAGGTISLSQKATPAESNGGGQNERPADNALNRKEQLSKSRRPQERTARVSIIAEDQGQF